VQSRALKRIELYTRHCADLPGHQAGQDNAILDDQAKKAETESDLLEYRHVSAPIYCGGSAAATIDPNGYLFRSRIIKRTRRLTLYYIQTFLSVVCSMIASEQVACYSRWALVSVSYTPVCSYVARIALHSITTQPVRACSLSAGNDWTC